jgi:Tfp pilus assembly protein PilV
MLKSAFVPGETKGFSLIEVVIALGICAFAIVAIFGMFSLGYKNVGEAGNEFNAANLASLIVAQRRADPTNTSANLVLPALNQPIATDWQEKTVGWDGLPSNDPNAPYRLRYRAGLTNSASLSGVGTNSQTALICISLSWPAAADATKATTSHYELVTEVHVPNTTP